MNRRRRRRGISLGTVVMLALTIVVCVGCGMVFPRLMGDSKISVDAGVVLDALNLSDELPELSLSEIPISGGVAAPTGAPTVGQKTFPVSPTPAPAATETPSAAVSPAPSGPTATPYPGGSITLTIGGSINMDDAVRRSGYYSDSEKYDFSEMLSLLVGEMESDVTMLSLENLVVPEKKVSSLITPEEAIDMLYYAGVDVVNLGFPQAFDQNAQGLASTAKAVTDRGLETLGAYTSKEDAGRYRIIRANNVSVAFLHYTQKLSSKSSKAIKKANAAYALPLADAETVQADIARVRSQGAQVVIVSLNWDTTKNTPQKSQTSLVKKIAAAGPDVIVGTGTGIVQPVVWLDGKGADGGPKKVLCAYSLGSLLSESRSNGGVASMLLQLRFDTDTAGRVTMHAAYTPTYIWRYKQDNTYYYRVVASDQPSPDGMDDDQTKAKERAVTNLQKYMGYEHDLSVRTK